MHSPQVPAFSRATEATSTMLPPPTASMKVSRPWAVGAMFLFVKRFLERILDTIVLFGSLLMVIDTLKFSLIRFRLSLSLGKDGRMPKVKEVGPDRRDCHAVRCRR